MKVSEAIRLKRAVREFSPEPLPEETMHAILNAGRRSPFSKNSQSWHFIAITDKATLRTYPNVVSGRGTWLEQQWLWPFSLPIR